MSGHSKWSKVKHQKAVTDVVRGKVFTKAAAAIALAVREGGGIADPSGNFKLRLAIERAKEQNVPQENIKRAIEKGKGSGGGGLESITYEAYGPGGCGLIIESVTDNRQRTVSQLKNCLERHEATLASPGAVLYMFVHNGLLHIQTTRTYDEILEFAANVGAEDVLSTGQDEYTIVCTFSMLEQVKQHVSQKLGIIDPKGELGYIAHMTTQLTDESGEKLTELIEALEELEDIQRVYTNAV